MTPAELTDTSTADLEVSKGHQPAPGAEEQKPLPATPEETVEAQETPEQQEAKKASKFQRRLDRQKSARVAAETEAKLLRERVQQLESQSKPQQQGDDEPKREAFADYEAYLRALAKYDATKATDQRLKARDEAQQGREQKQQDTVGQEKIAKAWAEREKSFQAATKDYETVVEPFVDEELKRLSQQARMAIVESEVGPGLLFQLAKLADADSDEFERICDLSPTRQIAELGKLEGKVSMPAKKTTSAPAPASTTSGNRTASKDPSKMDQTEYEAWRKTQGARWAR